MMTPELYLSLMTMHGTIMIFFVLSITPQSAFGHYFLPLQIGSRKMAFPLLSALLILVHCRAFLVMLSASSCPAALRFPAGRLPTAERDGSGHWSGRRMGQTLWIAVSLSSV